MIETAYPRLTMPTRPLTDSRKRYTPAVQTDIRRTFAVFQRLARMQARKEAK